MNLVAVKRYVEQVVDGKVYKGSVQVAGVKFNYEFLFTTSVLWLEETGPAVDEMQKFFVIKLKKGGHILELSEEEYAFFLGLLLEFILNFYENPQTRDAQNSIIIYGQARLSRSLRIKPSTIGMENEEDYDLSPRLCEVLASPKFGCMIGDH